MPAPATLYTAGRPCTYVRLCTTISAGTPAEDAAPPVASDRGRSGLAVGELAALELIQAAPDAVRFGGAQRERQALLAHRARGADRLGDALAGDPQLLALEVHRWIERRCGLPPTRSGKLPFQIVG